MIHMIKILPSADRPAWMTLSLPQLDQVQSLHLSQSDFCHHRRIFSSQTFFFSAHQLRITA